MKIKNDYCVHLYCSMLCKDHNVILAAFKFYSAEWEHLGTLFLPFTFYS